MTLSALAASAVKGVLQTGLTCCGGFQNMNLMSVKRGAVTGGFSGSPGPFSACAGGTVGEWDSLDLVSRTGLEHTAPAGAAVLALRDECFMFQPQGLSEQLGRTQPPTGSPGDCLSPGLRAAPLEAHRAVIWLRVSPGQRASPLVVPWALASVTWTLSGPHSLEHGPCPSGP